MDLPQDSDRWPPRDIAGPDDGGPARPAGRRHAAAHPCGGPRGPGRSPIAGGAGGVEVARHNLGATSLTAGVPPGSVKVGA